LKGHCRVKVINTGSRIIGEASQCAKKEKRRWYISSMSVAAGARLIAADAGVAA
jgi:hypothetical protein